MKIKQKLLSVSALTASVLISLLLLIVTLIADIPSAWPLMLLIPSAVLSAYERAVGVFFEARKLRFDENLLISLALILLFVSGHGIAGAISAVILRIVFIAGIVLCSNAKKIRGDSLPVISATAWILLDDGTYKEIPADELEIGTVVLVRPYEDEFVPADGIVVQGEGRVSAYEICGSDKEITVSKGSVLYSGMKSLENPIHIKVTRKPDDSAAAKIQNAMLGENNKKALRAPRLICRIAAPAALLSAIVCAILLIFVFHIDLGTALYVCAAMLLCVCPSIALSALVTGLYRAQSDAISEGMIFKNRADIENIASADAVIFDGAENLTAFNPVIEEIIDMHNIGKENIKLFFAALLQKSTLPMAKAVRNEISGTKLPDLDRVIEKKGMGVAAELDGKKFLCGTKELFDYVGIDVSEISADLYLSIGKKLYGALKIKEDSLDLTHAAMQSICDDFTDNIIVIVSSEEEVSQYQLDKLDKCDVKVLATGKEKSDFLTELSKVHKHIILFTSDDEVDTEDIAVTRVVPGFDRGMSSEKSDVILSTGDSERLFGILRFSHKRIFRLRLAAWVIADAAVLLAVFALFGYLPAAICAAAGSVLPIASLVGFSGIIKAK